MHILAISGIGGVVLSLWPPLASLFTLSSLFTDSKERRMTMNRSFFLNQLMYSSPNIFYVFLLDLHAIIRIKSGSEGLKISTKQTSCT